MSAGGQTPAPEDLRSRSADHQCPPPCSKSIRHLQDASGTDGKVAVNLDKLKLFWPYYVMNDRFWIPGKPFQSQQNRQWAGAIVTPSISDVPPPPAPSDSPRPSPSPEVCGEEEGPCACCAQLPVPQFPEPTQKKMAPSSPWEWAAFPHPGTTPHSPLDSNDQSVLPSWRLFSVEKPVFPRVCVYVCVYAVCTALHIQ